MDLTSGRPVWLETDRPLPEFAALKTDVHCDVVVIGTGITGALVAHKLLVDGLKVVMLDKRAAFTGSTSASTALLLWETDLSLAELSKKHGSKIAHRAYALGRQAVKEITGISKKFKVQCDLRRRYSLYLASDEKGKRMLQKESRGRKRAGFPSRWLSRAQLEKEFGLDYPGALYSSGAAEIDAIKLSSALLKHHVRARRLRVFSRTTVTKIEPSSDGVRLRTSRGKQVHARYVIVATGYEAAPFLSEQRVALHSSYVLASHRMPGETLWKDDCLIWETARPYLYARTTADRRVLIGGEDEPFADPKRRDAKLPAKRRVLEKRIHALFPKIPFKTEFAWTGTFAESADGLPFVGPKPGASPRVLYALGYGGNGITFSQIAAKLIAGYCQGKVSPDAKIFSFGR